MVPSPKIVINLPWTYEKLPCKEEPYQLSGQRERQKSLRIILSYKVRFFCLKLSNYKTELGEASNRSWDGFRLFYIRLRDFLSIFKSMNNNIVPLDARGGSQQFFLVVKFQFIFLIENDCFSITGVITAELEILKTQEKHSHTGLKVIFT